MLIGPRQVYLTDVSDLIISYYFGIAVVNTDRLCLSTVVFQYVLVARQWNDSIHEPIGNENRIHSELEGNNNIVF